MSVFDWMTQSKLKLNLSKIEFLLIGSEFQQKEVKICDPSAQNESFVGSVQIEKMGNMHDMG